MDRICPNEGTVCPAQVILEKMLETAASDVERFAIISLARSTKAHAGGAQCEGIEVEGPHETCGNKRLGEMRANYAFQRQARLHAANLPENVFSITRND